MADNRPLETVQEVETKEPLIDAQTQTLIEGGKSAYDIALKISKTLWNNPETAFKEHNSVELLTRCLEASNFRVIRFEGQLSTAFKATYGSGKPNVAIICEYDALPIIGHACGHNLIAEAGIIAGLAIKRALEEHPRSLCGTVTVFGTPAEEEGCGKALMIGEGLFEGVDVAVMAHPSPYNDAYPYRYLAVQHVMATYHAQKTACTPAGTPSPARLSWESENPLDAAVLAYMSISCLRQQFRPHYRVHGVITEGGSTGGSVPARAQLYYYIRAALRTEVQEIRRKVDACFLAAAQATGCRVDISEPGPMYDSLLTNDRLAGVFVEAANDLGLSFPRETTNALCGSTDMGNVSHIVPSIHPKYCIGQAKNHTPEFTVSSNTPLAHEITQKVGLAMGCTALRVLQDKKLLEDIQHEFKRNIKKRTSTL